MGFAARGLSRPAAERGETRAMYSRVSLVWSCLIVFRLLKLFHFLRFTGVPLQRLESPAKRSI